MNDKELARWEQNENHATYWRRFNGRAIQEAEQEAGDNAQPFTWIPDLRVAQAVAEIMTKLRKVV